MSNAFHNLRCPECGSFVDPSMRNNWRFKLGRWECGHDFEYIESEFDSDFTRWVPAIYVPDHNLFEASLLIDGRVELSGGK